MSKLEEWALVWGNRVAGAAVIGLLLMTLYGAIAAIVTAAQKAGAR